MATGKWWVTSDVYLPEEVGRGLCACDYELTLHMITFLPQQRHIILLRKAVFLDDKDFQC